MPNGLPNGYDINLAVDRSIKISCMAIKVIKSFSKNEENFFYRIEFGRNAGQPVTTGFWTYADSKNQVERDHNKETLAILEMKKSRMILEQQSIASGYIRKHRLMTNFFDYYREFVTQNRRYGNRHLENSLAALARLHKRPFYHLLILLKITSLGSGNICLIKVPIFNIY